MVGLAMLIASTVSYVALIATMPPPGIDDEGDTTTRIIMITSLFVMLIAGHAQAIVLATTAKSVHLKRYATYSLIVGISVSVMFFAYLIVAPFIGLAVGWVLFAIFLLTGIVHAFFNVESLPTLSTVKQRLQRRKETPT
jgi:hypothetical protein